MSGSLQACLQVFTPFTETMDKAAPRPESAPQQAPVAGPPPSQPQPAPTPARSADPVADPPPAEVNNGWDRDEALALAQERDRLQKRLADLEAAAKQSKGKNAAAVQAARDELARKEREIEEARNRAAAIQQQAETQQSEFQQTQKSLTEQAQDFQKKYKISTLAAAFIAGALVLVGLLAWWVNSRTSNKAAKAAREAQLERQRNERLLRNRPPPPFADCLLDGMDGAPSLKLSGAQLPEAAGGVVVGRHPDHAQAVFDKPEISRRHARFFVRNKEIFIEDCGSANGTRVDNAPVKEGEKVALTNGATIALGPYRFALRVGAMN